MAEQRSAQVRKRQDAFLAAYSKHGSILGASRACKLSREAVRQWRHNDPAFEKRFQDCKLELLELLEDGAVDDAMGEWSQKERRYVGGNPVLKIFLLKALAPDKYREQFKVEHDGKIKTGAFAALASAPLDKLMRLAGIEP